MENEQNILQPAEKKSEAKFTQSLTFKAIIIAALIMLSLIPNTMIQGLISERQQRSRETIAKINEKWSEAQTFCPPVLVIPYTTTLLDKDKKPYDTEHLFYLTPQEVKIASDLKPEERHYGIFKSIVYRSDIQIFGNFNGLEKLNFENSKVHFDKAYLAMGISDLRGVSQNVDFQVNGKNFSTEIGKETFLDNTLKINLLNMISSENLPQKLNFECNLKLNGSQSINFVPIAQTTQVKISGDWLSPSFVGAFSPNYNIDNQQFTAEWNVLSFNRNIPENWTDKLETYLRETSFGVNLVDTVDHYQQNMRSAKYALMFIALTFVVFFFVEALTKKRIHPVQYLLVGIALILFYSLLLSFSEQIGFAWAYLVASVATISLITLYTKGIFRSGIQTALLAALLCLLYVFLYVVLQLEDLALVIGSIGLFVILGVIMFVSRKIKWYKQ